ncbi:hypothetical protein MD484_g7112, partial [Candolleomyces efflorescens]
MTLGAVIFGPRFIPLFIWLDILVMIAELTFGIYAAVLILPEMNRYRWFSQSAIGGTFNFWFFAGAVALLLIIKVVQLIEARGCSFSQRVDILKDWLIHGKDLGPQTSGGSHLDIVQPVTEMGLTPNREFRSEFLSTTFTSSTPVVWNIIVIHLTRRGAPNTLRESLALQPLWGRPPGAKPSEIPFGPPCEVSDVTQQMVPSYLNLTFYEVVLFHCPHRVKVPPEEEYFFNPTSARREDIRPNLLLKANFTKLVASSDTPNDRADLISDSLMVYLALTTEIENVLLTTRSINLLPGTNLIGVADLIVRQRLKARELSTFGILDTYHSPLPIQKPTIRL